MVPKSPVCGLSGLRRKRDATFTALCEHVTVQLLMELKCAAVCYLQTGVFNPTNILNHILNILNMSNLILIITGLCYNLAGLICRCHYQ